MGVSSCSQPATLLGVSLPKGGADARLGTDSRPMWHCFGMEWDADSDCLADSLSVPSACPKPAVLNFAF